jgi:hypothetical protein
MGRYDGVNGTSEQIYLTLHQKGEIVSGAVAYQSEAKYTEIEHPSTAGDKLVFEVHDNPNRVVTFRLALRGNDMDGEATSGNRAAKLKLTKATSGVYRPGNGMMMSFSPAKTQKPTFSDDR